MTASPEPRRQQSVAKSATEKQPLTEKQQARIAELKIRHRARHDRPEAVHVGEGANPGIHPAPGEDDMLYSLGILAALGTRSEPFLGETLNNLTQIMSPNFTAQKYNAAMAIMASVEPDNELEATLASQMVAANECAMRCMSAMVQSDHVDHRRMHGDLANKFMRTFTAQIDALSRLRRGGEQIVKHVYVGEGGQAVFAKEIHHGRGGNHEASGQPYEPAPECAALPSPDPTRDGVPVPSNAERPMPITRRAIHGGAEG